MNPLSNIELYDIAVRLAAYHEQIKNYVLAEVLAPIPDMADAMQTRIMRVKGELGSIRQGDFLKLIRDIEGLRNEVMTGQAAMLEKRMAEIGKNVIALTSKISLSETIIDPSDSQAKRYLGRLKPGMFGRPGNVDRVLRATANMPMADIGLTAKELTKATQERAKRGLYGMLRAARAAHTKKNELIPQLEIDYRGGPIRSIVGNLGSLVRTSIHQVHTLGSAAVLSAVYDQYIWHSVLDSRTTEICRALHMRRFYYGRGPMPPRHLNCRSSISAVSSNEKSVPDENFSEWMGRQSNPVQRDLIDLIDVKMAPAKIFDKFKRILGR